MRQKALIIHHTSYHFETSVYLALMIGRDYDVSLWSSHLDVRGRKEYLKSAGISIFQGEHVEFVVIATDDNHILHAIPTELAKSLESKPIVRIAHDLNLNFDPRVLFFFPRAVNSLIPNILGPVACNAGTAFDPLRPRLLISGTISARRSYNLVETIAEFCPEVDFIIVGASDGNAISRKANIRVYQNLDESDYYNVCQEADFIVPLINPIDQPQYFLKKMSASILTGLALGKPFIGHEALQNIYPLNGFFYKENIEILNCILKIKSLTKIDYCNLLTAIDETNLEISKRNSDVMALSLHYARLQTGFTKWQWPDDQTRICASNDFASKLARTQCLTKGHTPGRLRSFGAYALSYGIEWRRDQDVIVVQNSFLEEVLRPFVGSYTKNPSGSSKEYSFPRKSFADLVRTYLKNIPFDESYYTSRYSDIARALAGNRLKSAHDHYLSIGYFEDRLPRHIEIDPDFYLASYRDVARIVGKSINKAQEHFELCGFREGRLPSRGWTLS